jgi:large subunit ribosomal protein L20
MIRVKRGNVAAKRRHNYLKLAEGYVGTHSRLSIMATEQVIQSFNYAYIGRRLKKRSFRKLWISRINSAIRARYDIYSKFIGSLRTLNIFINRKLLSILSFNNLSSFNALHRITKELPLYKSIKS